MRENWTPKKLVIIGAGSAFFMRSLVQDLLAHGGEWELRLADISPEALKVSVGLAERYIKAANAPITLCTALDHREVLPGCDAVVTTVGVGDHQAWKTDIMLPRKFGVYQWTGDTYGPGGISRSLRMIPVMVDIAKDIVALCPDALFVNCANPMSTVMRAMTRETDARPIGLCSGTVSTHRKIARALGVSPDDLWMEATGVNHFTWITDLRLNGEHVWPLVREKMGPKGTEEGRLSWELFDVYGAFPCVGDFHFSEFLPEWTKKGAYYGESIGMVEWGDSEKWVAYIDSQYDEMVKVSRGEAPVRDAGKLDDEQIIDVLDAYWRDKREYFYVNTPNSGQASNLPLGAILEGSTLIGASGFRPLSFGKIPGGIAALLSHIIAVQELMVDAALEGDRNMVVQALVAAGHVHTLKEGSELADALLNVQRKWLPRFFD